MPASKTTLIARILALLATPPPPPRRHFSKHRVSSKYGGRR
jgi:hypothetical protein